MEGLATIHDGLLYLVMGGVTAGHSVKDEVGGHRCELGLDADRAPGQAPGISREAAVPRRSDATINVPALMHIYPGEHPGRVLDLGLHNVRRNEPDFFAYAQVVTMAKGNLLTITKPALRDSPPRGVSGTDRMADAGKRPSAGRISGDPG